MTLITDLTDSPSTLSKSSRFTVFCGIFYMAAGLTLLAWPGAVQTLFLDPDFVGHEGALIRVIGMTVAVIGWFYFFGGRSGGRQIVAASVVDRIIVVPLVLIPTALAGVFPHLLLTFAVLDPILGLTAWYLLAREEPSTP